MAAEDSFNDEKDEGESVPNWHGFPEIAGEEAKGFGLSGFVELPNDGIDKEGDGELVSDHKADAKDSDDVEEMHAFGGSLPMLMILSGIRW